MIQYGDFNCIKMSVLDPHIIIYTKMLPYSWCSFRCPLYTQWYNTYISYPYTLTMYSFDNKVLANDSVNRKGWGGSSHHQGHWPSGFSALNNCIECTKLHLNRNEKVYILKSMRMWTACGRVGWLYRKKIIFIFISIYFVKTWTNKLKNVLNVNISYIVHRYQF